MAVRTLVQIFSAQQMASKSDDCTASPDDMAYCCLFTGGTSVGNGSAGKLRGTSGNPSSMN